VPRKQIASLRGRWEDPLASRDHLLERRRLELDVTNASRRSAESFVRALGRKDLLEG